MTWDTRTIYDYDMGHMAVWGGGLMPWTCEVVVVGAARQTAVAGCRAPDRGTTHHGCHGHGRVEWSVGVDERITAHSTPRGRSAQT